MNRPPSIPAKHWVVAAPPAPELQREFEHLSPTMLQVLSARGLHDIATIRGFLEGQYNEATDPFLLTDMDKAVERILAARERDETVVIYGDFDADGVTSTVLLVEALRGMGFSRQTAQPYIPDRVDEGYGLNNDALTHIHEAVGASLVISVDCGIRSVAEVDHANALGLDMIITDHHSIGPKLPAALAVINPKRSESSYPERMLAGVGIAYKLAQALYQTLDDPTLMKPEELLDLVAIGTVADLAPLLGENRQLVRDGLVVLNRGMRPGLAALVKISGLKLGQLTAESIGFGLGPRINAAGRLDHAYRAARLLTAKDVRKVRELAENLNNLNKERQQITRDLSAHAMTLVSPESDLIFAADERFVSGIVGLVASRLADNYYRPAIVIEKGEALSRGSCRSIPEIHITKMLDEVGDLLEHYGGHAQAAGLTIRNENLSSLQERLTTLVEEAIADIDLQPTLKIDADIPLHQVDWALFELLNELEPTGFSNPTPLFLSRAVSMMESRQVGADKTHLQLDLSSEGHGFKAIAFRQGAWHGNLPPEIDIAYTIGVNEWRGRRNLQLIIQDIRAAE